MKIQETAPTGKAQPLEANETFFSTTDERGVITGGNAIFARTSGYTIAELMGQPHNVIRHPDMPRQVFRRLWTTIKAGKSFMGYVKNHARNGNHYWVFAIVVPLPQGYLSVRIKPTSPLQAQVEALYRRMAEAETVAIQQGQSESHAADASAGLLDEAVRKLGYDDYASFSHHALNTEIKARDAEVAARSLTLIPQLPPQAEDAGARGLLASLYKDARDAYAAVTDWYGSLDRFLEASRGIRDRRIAVQRISDDFRLNAFNAHIATHPLGAEGATLGTVAQLFNAHAQTLSKHVDALADHIEKINGAVADMASSLCSARIQLEMLLSFICESGDGRRDAAELHRLHAIIDNLRVALGTTLSHGLRAVDTIQQRLRPVLDIASYLNKDIVYLQVAQTAGLIELSRLSNVDSLQTTFVELRAQIGTGESELKQLDGIVIEIQTLTETAPTHVRSIEGALRRVKEELVVAKGNATTAVGASPPETGSGVEDLRSREQSHSPQKDAEKADGEDSPHIVRSAALAPSLR